MSIKKTNNYLLFTVTIGMFLELLFKAAETLLGNDSWGIGGILHYLLIVAVGIRMIKKGGDAVSDYLPYNVRPKLRTLVLVILLSYVWMPVLHAMLMLGGYLFGDTFESFASSLMSSLTELSFPQQLLQIAVIPAVFEEVLYRGILYQGYRKGKGARTAILLTGLLFGTFHMIPQQALYAMCAGVVLAVIRELTGSMWPGMLLHFLNNGRSIIDMKLEALNPDIVKFLPEYFIQSWCVKASLVEVLIVAAVCLVLLYFILKAIARTEGRAEDFKTFFKYTGEKTDEKLVTAGLVLALLVEAAVMVATGPFVNWIKQYNGFEQ